MNAICGGCGSVDNLKVWVMPDPYYGYGHEATLRCGSCPSPGAWYEDHPYVPDEDDFYLGFTSKKLRWMAAASNHFHCFECKKLITTSKMGYETYFIVEDGKDKHCYEFKYCQGCTRKRKGIDIQIQYKNDIEAFQKRIDDFEFQKDIKLW